MEKSYITKFEKTDEKLAKNAEWLKNHFTVTVNRKTFVNSHFEDEDVILIFFKAMPLSKSTWDNVMGQNNKSAFFGFFLCLMEVKKLKSG